jgi:predicted HD phosphohydrolase
MVYYVNYVGANPNTRDVDQDHPYFQDCATFCESWEQGSFDPEYDSKPLEFFANMVREVFDREPYNTDVVRPGAREPLQNTPPT